MRIIQLCILIALSFILSACGGGSSTNDTTSFTLDGNVSGLSGRLTLGLNGSELILARNGVFAFEEELAEGSAFQVSIISQPQGQICSIDNASGIVGEGGITPLAIGCEDISHEVMGRALGLSGELQLELRSGDLVESIVVTDSAFSFLNSLAYGSEYSVVISQQPFAQICSISEAEGVISNQAPVSVIVLCEDITFSISGEASGLKGSTTLILESDGKIEELALEAENFSFATQLSVGEGYTVNVSIPPAGQSCVLTNNNGTVRIDGTEKILLSCTDNLYTLSGSVSGLVGTIDLRLITSKGAEQLSVSNGEFSFTTEVYHGDGYIVNVLEQPEEQTCTVENGSSVVNNSSPVILVTCAEIQLEPDPVFLSGIVSGLNGELGLSLLVTLPDEVSALNESTSSQSLEYDITISSDSFVFPASLTFGTTYQVIIGQQPQEQRCSLSNNGGTVSSSVLPVVAVECENYSLQDSILSGTITYPSNSRFDSDMNDPSTNLVDNSTFSTAQQVPNIVTIQGFATETPTGNAGDNFENQSDNDDYYRAALQAGQGLRLQVVDYDQFEIQGAYEGDLDLILYDANYNLVNYSNDTSEFEEITIENNGEYYIVVNAYSGASKYVLNLVGTSAATSQNKSVDFIPDEAVVIMNSQSGNRIASGASLGVSLKHQDKGRANLAKFNSVSSFSLSSAKASSSENELATLNPESYAKFQTLNKIKALSQDPQVSFSEPNYLRQPFRVPNDQYYSYQWHYPAMNLPQAWDISTGYSTTGSDDVVVAVIDTGVFLTHSDLQGQLVSGFDFISDPENSLDGDGIDNNPDDPGDSTSLGGSSWHGTHVAGTVAAKSNNGVGVAGVSWGAKIMPIRALGSQGGSSYDIIQSIRFAAGLSNDSGTVPDKTADVINLSLGGPSYSAVEATLYQQLYDMGIIVVAASGNESTSAPAYPASYGGVISVSALDANNNLAPYSNFGSKVDIAAPGGDMSVDQTGDGQPDGVLSTLIDDSSGSRQAIIAFNQGTSMAAPHVAGMFALMKAVYPELDAATVSSLLQNGSLTDDEGLPGRDNFYGYGTANAFKAVQSAQSLAQGDDEPDIPASIVASISNLNFGELGSLDVSVSNEGGGTPSVTTIQVSDDWLNVSALDIEEDGLGDYRVNVDRTGLSEGLYIGRISFNFDGANTLSLSVSMTVGSIDTISGLASIYVLIVDSSNDAVIAQTLAIDNGNGSASYSVPDVPSGSYVIFAGSDIDNDLVINQSGEAFGAYKSLADLVEVDVNGSDVDGLDFNVDIISGLGSLEYNIQSVLRSPLREELVKPQPTLQLIRE